MSEVRGILIEYAVAETHLNVTLVQGLINAGVIPDPRVPNSSLQGQEWFQHGHIVINNSTATQFNAWYQGISGDWDLPSKLHGYGDDMNQQQATSSDSP